MPTKRFVLIKGSPRKGGNSSILAEAVGAGASQAGASVTSFDLGGMHIAPCAACDACQGKNAGKGCVVQDDMQPIYAAIRAADVVVFASPVYWFNISAQVKAVIDRLYAVNDDEWRLLGSKRYALALSYGDSDIYRAGGMNAIRGLEDMARFLGAKRPEFIYASAMDTGEIVTNTEVMDQARKLGRRLALEA